MEENEWWLHAEQVLTAKQMEVVKLRLVGEMTWIDIGKSLGVSVQAARARFEGGLRRLRKDAA